MRGGIRFIRPGHRWQLGALIVGLLGCALLPRAAQAACHFVQGSEAVVQYSITTPVMIPNGAVPGQVLWESGFQSANSMSKVKCDDDTTGTIGNLIGGATTGDEPFPTNVPSIGYRLVTRNGTYLTQSSAGTLPGYAKDFAYEVKLQLVLTGSVSRNVPALTGTLARWNFGGLAVQTFSLGGQVNFVRPTCLVTVDPTVVTMQAITRDDLPVFAGRATAGDTPFSIQLNCSAGKRVFISIHTDSANWLSTDVINGQTGNGQAANVGIQISRPDGSPVRFDTKYDAGITGDGTFSIPFVASYFCTACAWIFNPPSPGKVTATATYTLTYE